MQDRHRSRAFLTALDRQPSRMEEPPCPCIISNSKRDRPRVECSSSRVTMYEGHITPPVLVRHLPMPMHREAAVVKSPWSSGNWKKVAGCAGR